MPKQQSGPQQVASGSIFPHIEAVLDARDAARVKQLFSESVDKLNDLLATPPKKGVGKRGDLEKALKSYELATALIGHLFSVKVQLEDKVRGRP